MQKIKVPIPTEKRSLFRCICREAIAAAIFLSVFFSISAGDQSTGNDYQALVNLHQDLISFRSPKIVGGIPDYRTTTIQAKKKGLDNFRQRLARIDPEVWPIPQKIDYLLVRAELNDLDFRLRVTRLWERDPGFYVEMINEIPYFDGPFSEGSKNELKMNLQKVPKILDQAKINLTDASAALARMAVRALERSDGVNQGEPRRKVPPEGVLGWYWDLIERLTEQNSGLLDDAHQAMKAVESYRDWLKKNEDQMKASAAVGLDNYNWYLKNVRLMPYTAEDLLCMANTERYRTLTFLKIEQHKNCSLPPLEPASSAEEHEKRVREAESLIRSFIEKHNILTLAEDIPNKFETDAYWIVRPGGKRHFWEEITYRDPLNNHIHASIPGHRYDFLLHRRDKRPIRGTYTDGGRAEGWACYLEEMFLQAGLLDERPRTRELFYIAQLKRILRVPTEIKMHSGELTLEQAIDFIADEVPLLDENLARYDLNGYLRHPTSGMTYLIGKVQLERLLAESARELGDTFALGEFHDEFLRAGMIPISLIRWEMTGMDDEVKKFWNF